MNKIEITKNAFLKNASHFLEEQLIDPQTIDILSEFDDKMLAGENLEVFKAKMIGQGIAKPIINQARLDEDDRIGDELAESRLMERLKQIKQSRKMTDFYSGIHEIVEKMYMDLTHLAFIKGVAGIGKTYQIKLALAKHGLKFIVAKKVSEPYLYRLLYENNELGMVIWIQDAARFFRQQEMIEFLKGVAETDPADRIATNYTYSKDNANLPKKFLWKGKLLFDYNNMVNLKFLDDYNALISRGEFLELVFSREEMASIMQDVAKTKEEKQVTEFLIANHKFINNNFFNLRTQQKAFTDYEYAMRKNLDWKKFLLKKFEANRTPIQSLLYQKMGDEPTTKVELIKWLVHSGNSGSARTATRKIEEWLMMEEIYNVSGTNYNPLLSLRSKEQLENDYIG